MKKVFFESPYNYSWIDLENMRDALNKACADGTKLELIQLQDLRHIVETLLFCEMDAPEVTETTVTYKAKYGTSNNPDNYK